MGSSHSNSEILIGTLNYSGIIASPYEFFEKQDEQEITRNLRFVLLFKQMIEQNYSFTEKQLKDHVQDRLQHKNKKGQCYQYAISDLNLCFSTIDKEWQKKRYSPLYNKDVGLKIKKFMENKIQFYRSWDKNFEQNKSKVYEILQKNVAKWKKEKSRKQEGSQLMQAYFEQKIKLKQQQKKEEGKEQQKKRKEGKKQQKKKEGQKNKKSIIRKIKQKDKNYLNLTQKQGQKQKWEETFQLLLYQIKLFDYLVYKAILYEIYTQQGQRQILQKLQQIPTLDRPSSFILDSKKYRTQRSKTFQKSYLNEQLKIRKTIKAIQQLEIDILFVQEASKQLVETIQKRLEYIRIVKPVKNSKNSENGKNTQSKTSSIIFINEKKFPKMKCLRIQNGLFLNNYVHLSDRSKVPKKLSPKEILDFNINNDTLVQAIGNLILVCTHLSSDKTENPQQIRKFKKLLIKLRIIFPQAYIVGGGDLNGRCDMNQQLAEIWNQVQQQLKKQNQLQQQMKKYTSEKKTSSKISQENSIQQKNKLFYAFPTFAKPKDQNQGKHQQNQQVYMSSQTTYKLRSYIQAQTSKSDKRVLQQKDYLLSNLQFFDQSVSTINNSKTLQGTPMRQVTLLPNDLHPFDHFLVRARIKLPKPLVHVYDHEYLAKYEPTKMTGQQYKQIYEKGYRNV